MSSRLLTVALSAFVLAHHGVAAAQAVAGAPSLIPASELQAQLGDPSLVLLHVGTADDYAKGHLPGALPIEARTLAAAPTSGGLTMQLPSPADLEAKLEALGITDTSRIVVYSGSSNLASATRVVFTLDYAGLGGRTRLLDGGLAAWTANGGAVTTDPAREVTRGQVTLAPRADAVASLKWVDEHRTSSDAIVVDARLPQFYTGESDNGGRIPRPGHVPGAKSLPFDSFLRADGTFKARAELEAMLTGAGAAPGRTTVATYCHVGQQATVPYFVARILGYDVKVFDGSYEEWSRTETMPVAKGSEP